MVEFLVKSAQIRWEKNLDKIFHQMFGLEPPPPNPKSGYATASSLLVFGYNYKNIGCKFFWREVSWSWVNFPPIILAIFYQLIIMRQIRDSMSWTF